MPDNHGWRAEASCLHTLGQPDWVAGDETGYVAIVQRLANDCPISRTQRNALRNRLIASPLCGIERYVRDLEALYRRMCAAHCDGSGQRLLAACSGGAPGDGDGAVGAPSTAASPLA
jgi:hypothetical protein